MTRVAALTLAVLAVGCQTLMPAAQRTGDDEQASQVAQIMRVAHTTRRGGDLGSAAKLYERAHSLAPAMAEPLIKLGEVLIALGQPRPAARSFEDAISLNQGGHKAHNGLGVSLDLLGEHADAQRQYRKGLENTPGNLPLRNNLALSLALAGNYGEAITMLTEIAADEAATPRYRLNLALVYGLSGETEKAAEAARMDLDEAQVQENLASYEVLRKLSGEARAAAIFGAHYDGVGAPPKEQNQAP